MLDMINTRSLSIREGMNSAGARPEWFTFGLVPIGDAVHANYACTNNDSGGYDFRALPIH